MDSRIFNIIGHRGACGYAPENTLRSFEKAIELGVDWVEFDVHFSKDGIPMVIHDASLVRTTTLLGWVSSTTSGELAKPCGRSGDPIPTLDQVLLLLKQHGVGAYVEIKGCPPGKMASLVKIIGEDRSDRVMSSFNPLWLQQARDLSHSLHLQPLFSRPPLRKPNWLDGLRPYEIGVGFPHLSAKSAKRMQHWGYPLVGYTVNDQEDIDRAYSLGLRGVFCDFPDRAPQTMN